MLRQLRTWLIILGEVGDAKKVGGQIDQLFRYYVLEVLDKVGLFEYLEQPRSYEEILNKFGFTDAAFTRQLLETLVADNQALIVANNGCYQRNPLNGHVPHIDTLVDRTASNAQNFANMAKGMTQNIVRRLRDEELEFVENFDGGQVLSKFDATLGGNIYTGIRNGTFALLSDKERKGLRGKHLLEVGCGTGRETAEIWLKYGGDIKITAFDPVPNMLQLAKERFPEYLKELNPDPPTLTEDNWPTFEVQDVTELPYPDSTFDAVYHAFVLHWTSDPARAVSEIVRVLKPGGFVFGTQPIKPIVDQYFDLVVRTSEDVHGFFYKEDLHKWYAEAGVELEVVTPMAIFRGFK
jgi:ubiquinone/menaquinone biosynthesis C-methylase UbiE